MTAEEFLAERRLRAAELALESARRRVAEADEEIAALRRQVAELEDKVLEAAGRAGAEPARLSAELEAERRVRFLAERALWAERERARGLEEELRSRVDEAASPAAERRLADAERRTRELKAELELVRHRAAEFEQQVRLAVDAAWRWLGETGDRVSVSLSEIEVWRQGGQPWAPDPPPPDPEDELLRAAPAVSAEPATTPPAEPDSGKVSDPGAGEVSQSREPAPPGAQDDVIPARFDDALHRLRQEVQADPDVDAGY
jgi:hypothetical protein